MFPYIRNDISLELFASCGTISVGLLAFLSEIPWLLCHLLYVFSVKVVLWISGEEECSFKGTARLQLMKAEIEQNILSYSRSGPKELWPSVSNFVLPISLNNHSQSPIAYLYFLDSGGGSYPEVISKSQVLWFKRKSQEINPDSR